MWWMLLSCGQAPGEAPEVAEQVTSRPEGRVDGLRFSGACDGSAAAVAPDGALLVGRDEGTELLVYRRDAAGGWALQGRAPLAAQLGQASGRPLADKDGVARELDLEGGAATGDTLWWIGSHGLSKKGKPRPNRQLLFATTPPGPGGVRVKGIPRDLTAALFALDGFGPSLEALHARGVPPKQGGVNIEGLAHDPTTGALLIGMRSPLTEAGHARVLALGDLDALRDDPAATPALSLRATLDLGGRGIRSIDWSPSLEAFVLVAGAVGGGGSFQLYRWDGADGLSALGEPIDGLAPEGLVEVDGRLLLLGDDSSGDREGEDCKARETADRDDPRVWFPARVVERTDPR